VNVLFTAQHNAMCILNHDFLLVVFHINDGTILYHFQDLARRNPAVFNTIVEADAIRVSQTHLVRRRIE